MGKLDEKSWWWFLLVCLFFFQKWCRVDDGHHFRMDRLLAEPPEHKICLQQAYDTTKTPKFFHHKQLIIQHTYLPPPKHKKKHHQGVLCFPPIISQIVLSGVLHVVGKLSEAAPLFARALEGREAELGQHHPDTLATVNNFAVLLEATLETPESGGVCFFPRRVKMTFNDLMTCHEGNMMFVRVFFFRGNVSCGKAICLNTKMGQQIWGYNCLGEIASINLCGSSC